MWMIRGKRYSLNHCGSDGILTEDHHAKLLAARPGASILSVTYLTPWLQTSMKL
ncbi:hypothetical protein BDY21DRAFT_355011 [Lineolata rhizophorae]|uniref:Uncharacterized protein n=1 Tax=Lineolata rhizophorae TaxID=578093 RepID=A0A6A6NR19_9PEZI|nr:hypothetical protein BDY21DRAFT_355011 [Lineolata rhizophorae]